MSTDRELQIKITGDASGAVAAATQTGDAIGGLSDKTKDYIARLQEGTTEANKFELKHRELREIVSQLSREAPELGLAARYLLNPWVASLGVILFGLNQISEHYKDLAETLRANLDIKPLQELMDTLGDNGLIKVLDDAGFASEDFIAELDKIASAQQNLKGRTDEAVGSIHAEMEAFKAERAATAERDIAQIHADEASGKITHAQAVIGENQVRVRQGDLGRTLAGQTEERIIAQKQSERAALAAQLDADTPRIREQHVESLQERSMLATSAAAAAKKQLDDQRAYMDKYVGHPGYDVTEQNNKERIAAHQYDKAQRGADEAAHAYTTAKKESDDLAKSLLDAANQLKALDAEIPKLVKQHADAQESRGFIGKTERETASLNTLASIAGSREGQVVERASGVQAALAAHKSITDQDREFYQNFLQIMTQGGQDKNNTQDKIIEALKLINAAGTSTEKRVQELEQLIDNAHGRIGQHSILGSGG